jgi:cation-transporting ATPase E
LGFERVILLAKSSTPIINDTPPQDFQPVSLILIIDHVREDAIRTIQWFKDNDVAIKVISGDNPITVSEVAKQAGIENAEKYINLTGLSNEEVANAALKYNVFGRVTPEQKEVLVVALKNAGHTVAMTGDGVNDILALKRADCSIAMASGSEAAKNVSHIVLLDSNFHSLPSVVGQGRRVINNLQRTCSLFLCKTLFAMVISVAFLVAQMFFDGAEPYPFLTNHLYVWEIAGIGLSAFFLALEGNPVKQQGNFLGNIIRRAIPGGLLMIITTALIFGFYHLQKYHLGYFGIYNTETATTMAVIIISLLSLVILFNVSSPLNRYRGLVFGGASLLAITALVLEGILGSINPEFSFLLLNVKDLLPINWFIIVISFVGLASVYIIIETIIKILKNKGEGSNDKN